MTALFLYSLGCVNCEWANNPPTLKDFNIFSRKFWRKGPIERNPFYFGIDELEE